MDAALNQSSGRRRWRRWGDPLTMLADVVSGYVGVELADVREDDFAHDRVTELVGKHTEVGRSRGRGRFEESLCI